MLAAEFANEAASYVPGTRQRQMHSSVPVVANKPVPGKPPCESDISVCASAAIADCRPARFAARVLPQLHVNDPVSALPVAECLAEAGVRSIIVSVSNAGACEAIQRIRQALPALQIGADLLQNGFARSAREAGADYLISLGTPRDLVASGNLLLLRAHTASELRHRLAHGPQKLVLAPRLLRGGLALLKILAAEAPTQRVAIVGSIERHDLPIYLGQCNVAAVAAPWVLAPELIRRRDWARIAAQARLAAAMPESSL